MATFSETGHAKNSANFNVLIQFATGYGPPYNPSNNSLKIPQLNSIYTLSQSRLSDVISKNTSFNNAVNDRVIEFDIIKQLSTRLINAFEATDATKEKIKDAKSFNRKIQGKRVSPFSTTPPDPNTPAPNTISSSQQSYDQQIQHFGGLVSVLQSEPSYIPNENDLKLITIIAKQASLIAKNNAVATAYVSINNSRIARNKTFYIENTGLVDIALEVKKYIKSVFGASSPEYAQVRGIIFRKIKS